jgi:cytochrome c oxidase subunit 1
MVQSFYKTPQKHAGILAWIFSTDHKRIGLLYGTALFSFFLVGVSLGLLMRLELIAPGRTIMTAPTYNALFTVHGVIMIFLFIIPGIPAVLGNFMLPLQIGARDVSFPRVNLMSWWFYFSGGAVVLASLFTGGGAPDTGWTFYVPYSVRTGTNVSLAVFGVFLLGISSTLTGLNFLTTIHRMRAPGMTWFRMPLFVWSLYATAWVQLLATPIIAITLVMIILERAFGRLFRPLQGRRPDPLRAPVLDLLPPRGLHHDPPRHGRGLRDHPGLRAQDHLRLQGDRVLQHGHRPRGLPGLGPSHVHERHERRSPDGLLPDHLHRGRAERHQGLQLGGKPV